MSRLVVYRMVAVGSLVTSATAVRVGVGWLELWAGRTPRLARLAVMASLGGSRGDTATATFRDDLLALGSDAMEVSWREMRRARDDFDRFTRPDDEPAAERPRRHRAKP